MKTALLLLLLGGFLCGLHGAEGQDPDLLIIITKLLTRVQDLEAKDQSHQSQVQSHQSQVQSLQSEVQSLKTHTQDLETKDQSHQSQVQSLQSEIQSLKTQIQTLELNQAQQQTNPRVAFSAGFNTGTEEGEYGPFDALTTIKYKKVLTNVGGGYSADTGKFTAPLKGTYVFSFVVHTRNNTFVSLKKNSEFLAYAYDNSVTDKWDSSTAVAVVTLEAGDRVYVVLERRWRFYGFRGLLNTFSGFLLFPM